MHLRHRILAWIPVALMAVSIWSCASIGKPSGGDKDEKGPEVIGVLPYPGTLFFNYREIEFHFDEFLKPGNYKNEIFISPVPPVDPEIFVKNKVLTIKFLSPLRENTTYVVTLGTGIADFNEGNKMDASYTYAFSTGNILDSLRFKGQVNDMWTTGPEKDMKLMLFRADEIQDNEIQGKRPEYLVTTGKSGEFEFRFLAPGSYKIYGVLDANNDSRYSGAGEKIALAKDPLMVLSGEDSIAPTVSLISFFQDADPPKVKSAKWSNPYTIHVEFTEAIRTVYGGDSLQISMIDTTDGSTKPLTFKRFKGQDHTHLYLEAAFPKSQDYQLRFVNVMDSLGQHRDTTVRLYQQLVVKEEKGKWFDAPVNVRRGHELSLPAYFVTKGEFDSTQVQLLDSAGVLQSAAWYGAGMELYCKPPKLLTPGAPYKVRLMKAFPLPDGKSMDSTLSFTVTFPNPNDFGTISGKILPDSTRPAASFVAILRGPDGSGQLTHPKAADKQSKGKANPSASAGPDRFEERFAAPGPFQFVYLMPGKYTMDIIDDTDGNGVLTPGSLKPYRLPEKAYHQSAPIDIKAKWDLKDVDVYPVPQSGKGGETKGTTGVGKLKGK